MTSESNTIPLHRPFDAITNELTAFPSFYALLNAKGGYRPSFLC